MGGNQTGIVIPEIIVLGGSEHTLEPQKLRNGNAHYRVENVTGTIVNVPKAEVGMRFQVVRASASSGRDVTLQAHAKDSLLDGPLGTTVVNETDAISGVLTLICLDGTLWQPIFPLPSDITSWVISQ